jgi:hypothetical protein
MVTPLPPRSRCVPCVELAAFNHCQNPGIAELQPFILGLLADDFSFDRALHAH